MRVPGLAVHPRQVGQTVTRELIDQAHRVVLEGQGDDGLFAVLLQIEIGGEAYGVQWFEIGHRALLSLILT